MERKEIIEKVNFALQNWSNKGDFPYDRDGNYLTAFDLELEIGGNMVATLEMNVDSYSCYDRGDYDTTPSWEGYYRWEVDKLSVYDDGELVYEEEEVEELNGEV